MDNSALNLQEPLEDLTEKKTSLSEANFLRLNHDVAGIFVTLLAECDTLAH